jgi:hypothetical protein
MREGLARETSIVQTVQSLLCVCSDTIHTVVIVQYTVVIVQYTVVIVQYTVIWWLERKIVEYSSYQILQRVPI